MTPELASALLKRIDNLNPIEKQLLHQHVQTWTSSKPQKVLDVFDAWYAKDPASVEVFIQPMPAAYRMAFREYLNRRHE